MGIVDVGKIICPLDKTLKSGSATGILGKEMHFWQFQHFNKALFRSRNSGDALGRSAACTFFNKWRERERVREAAVVMFFAFSHSHLVPAFIVMPEGTVLNLVVFIVEFIVNVLCKCKEEIKAFEHWDMENVVLVLSLILQI